MVGSGDRRRFCRSGPASLQDLRPLNRLWLRFGLLLAAVVSPIVLALLFYLTIAPIGFMMRLAGKDPMRSRRDPNATSYWIRREPPGPATGFHETPVLRSTHVVVPA